MKSYLMLPFCCFVLFAEQIDRLSVGSPNADTPARHSETLSTTQHPPSTTHPPPSTTQNPPTTMRPSPSTKVVLKNLKRPMNTPDTAILVITCNRVDYLKRTLEQVLEKRPPGNQFSVIVSQDCDHKATSDYLAQHEGKIKVIKVRTYVFVDMMEFTCTYFE